jgi:hypothetical protein
MTDSIRWKDIFVVGGEELEPYNTHGGQEGLFIVQPSDCAMIVCGANGQF